MPTRMASSTSSQQEISWILVCCDNLVPAQKSGNAQFTCQHRRFQHSSPQKTQISCIFSSVSCQKNIEMNIEWIRMVITVLISMPVDRYNNKPCTSAEAYLQRHVLVRVSNKWYRDREGVYSDSPTISILTLYIDRCIQLWHLWYTHLATYSCMLCLWWQIYGVVPHDVSCLYTILSLSLCKLAIFYKDLLLRRKDQNMSET